MSHPCGRYNNNTLKILKKLNIKKSDLGRICIKNILKIVMKYQD